MMFDRIDLTLILLDGTRGRPVVIYHDGLLPEILKEAQEDARRSGTCIEADDGEMICRITGNAISVEDKEWSPASSGS